MHLEIKLVGTFLGTALMLLGSISAEAREQPNIILVMPDDVGYGDYRCLGNPIIRTPSVDAFKKKRLTLA